MKRPRTISFKSTLDGQIYVSVYDTFGFPEGVKEMQKKLKAFLWHILWGGGIGEVFFKFDVVTRVATSHPLGGMSFARQVEKFIVENYCQKKCGN